MAAIPAAIFVQNAEAANTPTHHPHTRFSILKSHFLKNNKNFL